jgi:hypothetical protein
MSKDFSGLPGVLTVTAVYGVKTSSSGVLATVVLIDNRQGTRAAQADARRNLIFIAPSPTVEINFVYQSCAIGCNRSATVD